MELMDDLVKERFGADAARELCQKPGLFERGRVYRRIQISRKLRDEFVERGGDEKTTPEAVAVALKKWLVASDSPFSRVGRGRYRFAGVEASTGQMFDAGVVSEGSDAAYGEELTPQRELGSGPHEVYAWCLPQYQETFGDRWPIKIGRAGPDGLRRRIREIQESLPERPRYLLRLGCADDREAKDRESLLHAWFRSRRQKLDDLPGEEWFVTNPDEIEEAIRNITGAGGPTGDEGADQIEAVIAAAFKDVPVEDWDRLPEDLTDRLDDYLYGDERR